VPRGNVRVSITGDADGLQRATRSAERDLDRFGKSSSKSLGALKTAAAGAATAGVGLAAVLGIDAVKAAAEAEKSQARLQAQLKANEISWQRHAAEIDKVIQKHSLLSGIDDEDLQDAFTNIIRVTGDLDKGLRLVGLASDIARAKQMEVAKAGELVAKVAGGNIGILARYGIVIKDGSTATEALAQLQQKFAGQAEAYGKTASGSLDRLKVAWENIAETLGQALTPHLAKAADSIARFIRQMQTGKGAGGEFKRTLEEIWPTLRTILVWTGRAIRGIAEFSRFTRDTARAISRFFSDVWTKPTQAFRDFLASVLRGMGRLFDLAGKLPLVGDKFDRLGDKAREMADEVQGVGEKATRSEKRLKSLADQIRGMDSKTIDLKVVLDFATEAFSLGMPDGDGWGDETATKIIKRGAKAHAQKGIKDGSIGIGGMLGGGRGSSDLMGANAALGPFAAIGARFGLSVTSGLRPGSITSSGNPSHHSTGRAIDVNAGSAAQMMAYARFMAAQFGSRLSELIYTPMGFSIKNGQRVAPYAQADHYDHVHVALQRGGKIPGTRTGDKNLAALEDGEFVVNREATAKALPFLQALNAGIPRFQSGGINVAAKAAYAAGFRGEDLVRMVAEAGGESGYNPRAVGDGGWSKGLWQIYTAVHTWARTLNLFDPYVNARAAKRIFDSQGVGAWHGDHTPYIDQARAAVAALSGGRSPGGTSEPAKPKPKPTRGPSSSLDIRDARTEGRWDALENSTNRRQIDRAYRARAKVFNQRIKQKRSRLAKINNALRGRLTRATRQRLLAEKATLVRDINTDIGSLKQLTTDFQERVNPDLGASEAGDAPSPFVGVDMQSALARLTPGTEDDLAALRTREGIAAGGLALATAYQSPEAITEWANELASTREAIEGLTGEMAETRRFEAEKMQLEKELVDNQRKLLLYASTQGPALIGAVVAAANGGIGGKFGLGNQTPSFAGVGGLARY
jgi:hypothetical protein